MHSRATRGVITTLPCHQPASCLFLLQYVASIPSHSLVTDLAFPTSPFQGRGWSFIFMLCLVVVLALFTICSSADLNVAYISYYNDFIEPSYILGKNWSRTTVVAQQSIIQWADWLAAQGPWCMGIPPHL
jgi:hypothetical protein